MRVKNHKVAALTNAGEKTRVEQSWTVTCSCGFSESCSTKAETLREFSLHIQCVLANRMQHHCIECKKEKAKIPEGVPRFCSVKCGFSYGFGHAMNYDFCRKHEQWFNDGVCHDCHLDDIK